MMKLHFRNAALIAVAALCAAGITSAQAKRPITFDDMEKIHRVGEPQISRDGKWVVYTVTTPDLDANRNAGNLWMVGTDGSSAAVQLTQSGRDSSPVWSPDGKQVAFLSSRGGSSQVYILFDGGRRSPAVDASFHRRGHREVVAGRKTIAFTSGVYPDCKDDACNKARDDAKDKNKVKAHVATQLLYRHWTHWSDGSAGHLFVIPAPADSAATMASAEPRDLTPGADYDVPPDQRGGPDDINFSPDGTELCFTAVWEKIEAISTNGDLFLVPVAAARNQSASPPPIRASMAIPFTSPDGAYIAYHAQLTPEYEADRWRVMLYDRKSGKIENLSEAFDRSAQELAWSADSKKLFFTAEDETLEPIYAMDARAGSDAAENRGGWRKHGSHRERGFQSSRVWTFQPGTAGGNVYGGRRRQRREADHAPQ